jgi:hypothetical protein
MMLSSGGNLAKSPDIAAAPPPPPRSGDAAATPPPSPPRVPSPPILPYRRRRGLPKPPGRQRRRLLRLAGWRRRRRGGGAARSGPVGRGDGGGVRRGIRRPFVWIRPSPLWICGWRPSLSFSSSPSTSSCCIHGGGSSRGCCCWPVAAGSALGSLSRPPDPPSRASAGCGLADQQFPAAAAVEPIRGPVAAGAGRALPWRSLAAEPGAPGLLGTLAAAVHPATIGCCLLWSDVGGPTAMRPCPLQWLRLWNVLATPWWRGRRWLVRAVVSDVAGAWLAATGRRWSRDTLVV